MTLWELRKHCPVYHYEGHRNEHSLCKYTIDSLEEQYVASGDEDGLIRVWNLRHSLPIKMIHSPVGVESNVLLSRPLFTSLDGLTCLWAPFGRKLSLYTLFS
jgi:WD40 repeat protein